MYKFGSVIDVNQLVELRKTTCPVILFSHMNMPVNPQQGATNRGYIPESMLFDFETDLVDKQNPAPHMLPSLQHFAHRLTQMGINNHSSIVVYDNQGMFSAPRVWWMLKALGHENVFVLNGGLQAWIDAKLPLATKLLKEIASDNPYRASTAYQYLVNKQQILLGLQDKKRLILDARGSKRFFGLEPEPRSGVRSGHIPNSKNLHYAKILDEGYLVDKDKLSLMFAELDQDMSNKQLIFSCGSGVTASILALAADQVGLHNWSVYDGSWSEWGCDSNCPIEL